MNSNVTSSEAAKRLLTPFQPEFISIIWPMIGPMMLL